MGNDNSASIHGAPGGAEWLPGWPESWEENTGVLDKDFWESGCGCSYTGIQEGKDYCVTL
jgi:hypothetical protein